MEWILILYLQVYKGGGLATETFKTQEACHYAGQLAKEKFKEGIYIGYSNDVRYICVPKGEIK